MAREVVERAREERVLVMEGERCDLVGRERWRGEVRVSVSYCALEEIVEGIQRLGRAVGAVRRERGLRSVEERLREAGEAGEG